MLALAGVFDYKNGDHFEGHWIEDKKEGQGVHFYYHAEKKAHTKRCAHAPFLKPRNRNVVNGPFLCIILSCWLLMPFRMGHTCDFRYDGEWVDDGPKCGAYTEMPPDELAPASQLPDPIPGVELQDPAGVLTARLSEIRTERAQHRATRISLEEQFTPEELNPTSPK